MERHLPTDLADVGIRAVQTPFQAPNCNAYAERFVRSIKEECLNRVIPFGERQLRQTIAGYASHYHRERNHQGIENRLIEGAAVGECRPHSPSAKRRAPVDPTQFDWLIEQRGVVDDSSRNRSQPDM